jgi:hypothetical protein
MANSVLWLCKLPTALTWPAEANASSSCCCKLCAALAQPAWACGLLPTSSTLAILCGDTKCSRLLPLLTWQQPSYARNLLQASARFMRTIWPVLPSPLLAGIRSEPTPASASACESSWLPSSQRRLPFLLPADIAAFFTLPCRCNLCPAPMRKLACCSRRCTSSSSIVPAQARIRRQRRASARMTVSCC